METQSLPPFQVATIHSTPFRRLPMSKIVASLVSLLC